MQHIRGNDIAMIFQDPMTSLNPVYKIGKQVGEGLRPVSYTHLAAKTPFLDSLDEKYPHTTLGASGEDVGLPHGQMGNSEVGHLNICLLYTSVRGYGLFLHR